MFVPQVFAAIAASLGGPGLASRLGWKRAYLAGSRPTWRSMALLIAGRFVQTDQGVAYPILLAATAFLGLGFGLTVPALNTFTAEFHPGAVDRSVLRAERLGGTWRGAGARLHGDLCGPRRLGRAPGLGGAIPASFGVFAVFAVLYGCETMNGTWCWIHLTGLHVSATTASLTLAVVWAMVAAERVPFAAGRRCSRAGSLTTSCPSSAALHPRPTSHLR